MVKDAQLTVKCPAPVAGLACGDFAVNTTQPFYQPFSPGTADARRLPPLTNPTIGDRLSAAGVDWANMPAISDLLEMFDFDAKDGGDD